MRHDTCGFCRHHLCGDYRSAPRTALVCFGGKKGVPRLVAALGETLPPAIMAALVVYCLKSVPFGTMTDGRKAADCRRCGGRAASLEEEYAAQHRARGTALYMLLIRL